MRHDLFGNDFRLEVRVVNFELRAGDRIHKHRNIRGYRVGTDPLPQIKHPHRPLKLSHHGWLERREFAQVNQHRLEQIWIDMILEFDFNFGELFDEIPTRVEHTHVIKRDFTNVLELINQSFRLKLRDRFEI